MRYNEFNQPIGEIVSNFTKLEAPSVKVIEGQYCRLEKLSNVHTEDLYQYFIAEEDASNWTYLPDNQPQDYNAFESYIAPMVISKDPYFFAIIDKSTSQAVGLLSFLRIDQDNGVIEVGHIHYANILKRSRIATEAQYLLAKYVFDTLGYRRYEWKCDALNEPSIRAAKRLGFKLEGIFHQHKIYKNRNRDTCWLAMTDHEWYNNKPKFEKWLSPQNFNEKGEQLSHLSI
ncbi:GNAT family N-acetyltransferase [Staphylococcus caeli]|uniref:Acetyltransferase n=1 Tax=Staphylococcus caeli TaxID=2201815 RepID=A0A1D4MF81_9STAP|nr:GNAT family protein [Staphylococcus caeli]SCS97098.1 acetyltransferase [Staphylococcus caeli]SCT18703.1 acetyltransferase [Staphylococcus caeli]